MRAHNPSHALALVVVDELARLGVTDAVLAPGSRSAALAMAFHDDPRIRLHVEIDERSAGFFALGLARATGRPAPVIVTSGSAVANLHPAVVEADTSAVPLLLLTADRPPELRHTGANQAIDQVAMFGRAVRWSVDLGVAEDHPDSVKLWRSTLARAVAATQGTDASPGPVQVNLGFREPTVPEADDGRSRPATWSQPLEGRSQGAPWAAVVRARRSLDDAELDELARQLVATERGLIVVGSTAADPDTIAALADATGWPVLAEATSGARIGERAIVHAHHLLTHEGFAAAHVPDLVVTIGRVGVARPVVSLLGHKVPQLLIDPDGRWHDPQRGVDRLLRADVEATCSALAERLGTRASSAWLDSWLRADQLARTAAKDLLDGQTSPSEPRIARDLAEALPDGTTLVVASSMPVRDLDLVMAPRRGLRFVANRGASGIDGFVSTTLGVAVGRSADPTTVALTGDLSLLHDANGFLLSPGVERLDVIFVVIDNDGGGIFSFLPQARFPGSFERVFGTPHRRDLTDLARLHHLRYAEVTRSDDLVPAVDRARQQGGIWLLHVRTDRDDNVAVHRQLSEAVHHALDAH